MNSKANDIFQNKFINNWNLWWLAALPISAVMLVAIFNTDLDNGAAVSSMIELSVRMAVPFIFLSFAASSVHTLFASPFSRWLLRNRKIIGLIFAAAMAWQLLFIITMVGWYTDYYVEEVYALSDVVEGVVGYAMLIAMVLTSFKFARSRMSPGAWKLMHKFGIYWLWAYAWSVYWWQLFYYHSQLPIDYIYYWVGLLAWMLRLCAWMKKNWKQAAIQSPA